jgi:dethiobiotin synthetase
MTDNISTKGLFVTATDTSVGKTYLTSLIARSLPRDQVRVGAYKPVCSGAEISAEGGYYWTDIKKLTDAIGVDVDPLRICPQRLKAPLAPPIAARIERVSLDFEAMKTAADWWLGHVDVLLIEGVGGLLCPLTEDKTIADLAVALGYPLLVVARAGLGTINHTLLTVEAARHRGLQVAGVVLNEAEPLGQTTGNGENSAEIARRANVPVLGIVRYGSQFADTGKGRLGPTDWLSLMAAREPARK